MALSSKKVERPCNVPLLFERVMFLSPVNPENLQIIDAVLNRLCMILHTLKYAKIDIAYFRIIYQLRPVSTTSVEKSILCLFY